MRNSLAGKSTGKSISARYFASHPAARRHKLAYDKKYHATPERIDYRARLNRANRLDKTNKKFDGKDMAHSRNNTLKQQDRSINRSFNGRGNRSRFSR